MTTNQTIDGVPRELLEHLVDPVNHIGRVKARAELHALLDAPAVERKPFGWFRTPKDCPLQGMFLHYDPEHGERDIQNALDFGFTVKRLYDTPAAQPQGEPVAWQYRVSAGPQTGWSLWHDGKGEDFKQSYQVETRPLYAEQPAPVAVVPDGYCIMPRQLTAENGAKALLLGEFKLLVTKECHECCELEEPTEGCSICDGEGEYGQKHTIPWDQIKFIYSKAVSGLAVKAESANSR